MKNVKMIPISAYVALKLEVDRLTDLVVDLNEKLSRNGNHNGHHLEKGILINSNGQSKFIKISEIVMIKAESNYSSIYTAEGNCHLTSKTLKYWEEKCNVSYLVRLHKSYLVNFGRIKNFELSTGKVQLDGDMIAQCSKNGKKLLAKLK